MMNGRILHFVPNTDMRCSHDGLADLARKELKVKVAELEVGEFVVFVNTSWTMLKAYCAHNIVLSYKRPDGGKLNPKAVLQLPRFIRGQDIGYKEALTETIEAEYVSRYPRLSQLEQ